MSKLSHLDEAGAARMVDVSEKPVTAREASAEAVIRLSPEAYDAAIGGTGPKGDVLAAARLAGIMAAKKTSELIPLCHPLPIAKAGIDFEPQAESHSLRIIAMVKTTAQTGIEMEALTAASVAALTVYDMVKAVDKTAVIETVRLLTKSGGKSGTYIAPHGAKAPAATAPKRQSAGFRSAPGARPAAATLMGEGTAPSQADPNAAREAFRAFMTGKRLRATEWAKEAGVPAAQIYSFLTGKSRSINPDTAEKLARAARVSVSDLFRTRK
ncbi:MAG: cyclic pyranopterin monophosphate synthase MoaC [Pseudomonadota bacterium]|nr:cyclic pyranopterin monophosphate synthase MoaC [Pseudomonadota bacterium]